MNKKFSTLVVGVLLAASVGTVNAANPVYAKSATSVDAATKILADKYYQLQVGNTGAKVIGMYPANPVDGTYTLKQVDLAAASGQELRYTLWKIEVSQNTEDGYRYAFVNLGTGQTLSYDPAMAVAVDATPNTVDAAAATATAASKVGGTVALWKWVASPAPVTPPFDEDVLTSVFNSTTGKDSVVTMALKGNDVVAVKYALANLPTASTLKIRPAQAKATLLGVDDLNSMLWNTDPAAAASKLKLTFTDDVKGGNPAAVNLFTNQSYKAQAAVGYPFNVYQAAAPATATAGLYTDLAAYESAQSDSILASKVQLAIGTPTTGLTDSLTAVGIIAKKMAEDATAVAAINAVDIVAALNAIDEVDNKTANVADADGTDALTPLQEKVKAAIINYVKAEGHSVTNAATAAALLKKVFEDATGGIVYDFTQATNQADVKTKAEAYTVTAITTARDAAATEKNDNYLAATANAIAAEGWVSLKAEDGKYLAVDTSYMVSEGQKLLKLTKGTFADLTANSTGYALPATNKTRLDINGRYNFQFVYHPYEDSIVIRTAGYATLDNQKVPASGVPTTIWKDLDLTDATLYPAPAATNLAVAAIPGNAEMNLVKIKVLGTGNNHREVTIGSSEYDGLNTPAYTINTRISINGTSNAWVKTTLPSGVYFFNYVSNLEKNKAKNGKYQIASFCGSDLDWANEEVAQLYGQAQDFGHMPRTQWVIEQNNGIAGEQTINIYNREFPKKLYAENIQLFKAGDKYFIAYPNAGTAVVAMDTLAIRKATDVKPIAGILTNKYLGYNVVEQDELSRKSFIMDYFNGIQVGHYVNVSKTATDTTVYVDLKGEKVTLELVPVQDKDQKFGYEGAAAPQLYNRSYAIRVYDGSKLVNNDKFIVEDPENEASYAISAVDKDDAAHFYLKENNQLISEEGDTTCYYALVGGNTNAYNRVGVRDASQRFSIEGACSEERVATFALKESDTPLYRRLGVSNPEDGLKDMDVNKYAKIFRVNSTAKEYLYEDGGSVYSKGKGINFLGVEGKGDNKLSALYVDTAYVRNETKMPQYMFAVGVTEVPAGMTCPDNPEHDTPEYIANHGDCGHKVPTQGYKIGRYLVNAEDSVQLAANGKDYIWNEKYTRLAFVWAKHIGDTLIVMRHGKDMDLSKYAVASDSIFLGDNKHNMATWTLDANPSKNTKGDSINAAHEYGIKNAVFALRLVDDKPACDFLIESVGDKPIPTDGQGGWIKIQNGVPVIARAANYNEAILDTEIFNIEPTEEVATSNDAISTSEVSVIAGNGQVTIKGAAGKNVVITNVLGQTIANTVVTSDEATIAAPAGVIVVAVEGEAAVKAIVK